MNERRPQKKSESIEVRVSHEVKSAFMRKALAEGRSASDVVRGFIALYLADQTKEARSMIYRAWKPAAVLGGAALAILWSALAPSPVSAAPDLRAAFARFDRDGDRAITLAEFLDHSPDMLFVNKADSPPPSASTRPFIIPLRRAVPAPPPSGTAPPEAMLRAEFVKHDGDGDGSVTFAEFETYHLRMIRAGFVSIDRNGDGGLDRAEFETAVRAAAPHRPRPRPRRGSRSSTPIGTAVSASRNSSADPSAGDAVIKFHSWPVEGAAWRCCPP
jgi:Ca2+-binding EF-hand superfamily protein